MKNVSSLALLGVFASAVLYTAVLNERYRLFSTVDGLYPDGQWI